MYCGSFFFFFLILGITVQNLKFIGMYKIFILKRHKLESNISIQNFGLNLALIKSWK